MGGITHVYIPAAMFRLGLRGMAEISILALAASFGDNGLTMSNSRLAESLGIARQNTICAIARLKKKGLLTEHGGRAGHRLLASPQVLALLRGNETIPQEVSKHDRAGHETLHITKGTEDNLTLSGGRPGFVPPSIAEVEEYIRAERLCVDAAVFHKYFTESGWVDSRGRKVRNWKQKAITWHSHRRERKDGVNRDGIVRNFGNLSSAYGQSFSNNAAAAAVPVRSRGNAADVSRLRRKEAIHLVAEVLPGMRRDGTLAAPSAGASPQQAQAKEPDSPLPGGIDSAGISAG